ncbi:hypothetical protein MXD63_13990 [Frankia sp. Cpl3]|uniref:hypothetical protein n=1 Tax=Parafrankia colletiae TaxID=573497 RepID=UPI0018E29CF0|nr:hypothetical protein [Parafrankia colletiae]MCK9901186.1 hypothetical protein [Frankia sp. Cpl3]
MSDGPVFVDPWLDLRGGGATGRQQRETIARELRKEIAADHPLYSRQAEVIARSLASDDIVVELASGPGRWAQVHLTWKGAAETPPWPTTTFYDTIGTLEEDLHRAR